MAENSVNTVLTAMNENNEEVEAPEYELPEDLVSDVKPSQYLADIYQEPIIDFAQLGNRVPEFLKMCKYDVCPNYQDIPITESYKMFVNSFNDLSRQDIYSPPENIVEYSKYLAAMFPGKLCFPMASSWPPSFPRITPTVEPTIAAMIKMLSEANDPTAMLRFFSFALFPKNWTINRCGFVDLLALCTCKFKGNICWAYIIRSTSDFYLTRLTKENKLNVVASGTVGHIAKTKDQKSLVVKDDKGHLIATFEPLDINQTDLWVNCLNKPELGGEIQGEYKFIPFPYFLTDDLPWFPDHFYPSFVDAIMSSDGVFIRTLISIDPPYEIADALLTIGLYTRKTHQLFGSLVGYILENDELNPMAIYAEDSFYRKFTHALFKRFSSSYMMLLKKLVTFIDRHSGLDETVFFSVIKYIMKSGSYIPIQVRHFASIIRSYAAMKFNSRGLVYFLLGGFFGLDFICPVLANPKKYFPDLPELKNPRLVKQVSDNLQFLFHGALLGDSYSTWNRRIHKHTIPQLEEFLFSLGDISGEIPPYSPPLTADAAMAVEKIIHTVVQHKDVLRQIYDENQLPNASYPPQLGYNFSSALGDFFRQCFDKSARGLKKTAQRVKPNPLKFPPLPMYGAHAAAAARKGQNMFLFNPESYADPATFRERDLGGPSSPQSMRLPLKPKKLAKSNPLKAGKSPDDNDSDSSFSDHHAKRASPAKKKKAPQMTSSSMPEPPKKKSIASTLSSSAASGKRK